MTLQEIFDTVAKHLLTQGTRSYSEFSKTCLYRGPNGTKCAVGVLIKDEFYSPELECNLSCSSVITYALEDSGVSVDEITEQMLRILQKLHDGDGVYGNFYTPSEWSEGLKVIAKKFNLQYNEGKYHEQN